MAETQTMIAKIRLRRELHNRLVMSAKRNGRTLSDEIVSLLEEAGDEALQSVFADEFAKLLARIRPLTYAEYDAGVDADIKAALTPRRKYMVDWAKRLVKQRARAA